MRTTFKNSSITMHATPSADAIIALAAAVEANAQAIRAIADKLTTTAPVYGVNIAPAREE